jgi:N-acetylmuramoyl-L-alanine amidase
MKICVDAGHGMSAARMGLYDPGAVAALPSERFEEADIALDWALELGVELQARGQQVYYTRRNRLDPCPTGIRASRAQQQGCTVFVSMHANAFTTAQANGTETLYRSNASEPVARAVNTALVAAMGTKDRGPKYRDNLAVLKFSGVAILIEMGFITNDDDREKMLDSSMRTAGVLAIASSLLRSLP